MKSRIKKIDVIKYFREKTKPYKKDFFKILIYMIIAGVEITFIPYFYTKIIDIISQVGIEKNILVSQCITVLIALIICQLLDAILTKAIYSNLTKHEYTVYKDISQECFNYLSHNSYKYFLDNKTGVINSQVNNLSEGYLDVIDEMLGATVDALIGIPTIIIIISLQNIWIGLIFIIFIIIFTIIQIKLSKKNEINEIKYQNKVNKLNGEMSDMITNHFNILTFSSFRKETKRFLSAVKDATKAGIKKSNKALCINSIPIIIKWLFFSASLFVSIKLWGNGLISISIVILVELYSQKLSESLEYVINVSQSLNEVLGESTEMLEILNTPHEIQDKTNKKLKIGDGRIDFKNVKFAYDNGEYIFDGLNLKVKPGEKIALVGQSGSGKSTLTKLLFRFYDIQGGTIKIDDQDISQVTQESLRNEISIVPQDVVLFHRSIKENICYGNPTATEEEMIAACKMARCHEFIIKLENGYDTLVGERGIKLSGGERQRIAIARAILENKKILVMDEATSSLDSESEKCIQDAMDEVMKNKTCIVIAHRLSTIKEMDRIIFIENGKIVEEGSHETLINIKRGKYKKLRNLQLGGFLK